MREKNAMIRIHRWMFDVCVCDRVVCKERADVLPSVFAFDCVCVFLCVSVCVTVIVTKVSEENSF